jgi:hypothetical protein
MGMVFAFLSLHLHGHACTFLLRRKGCTAYGRFWYLSVLRWEVADGEPLTASYTWYLIIWEAVDDAKKT